MKQGMPYSWIALILVFIGAGANTYQAIARPTSWILLFVNVICIILLSMIAINYYKKRRLGFDVIVAAETIVAFGVASLIFSLVSAIYPLVMDHGLANVLDGNRLIQVATPFLEGLATAGVAPLGAMFLRNRVSELDGSVDPVGDADGLSRAMNSLTAELVRGHKAAIDLNSSLTDAAVTTKALANVLRAEGDSLQTQLTSLGTQIASFGTAAKSGHDSLTSFGAAVNSAKTSLTETTRLLNALAELIKSVERFVAPGTRRSR
jgi:hypothetical protein